jgi:hypothetical protein
VWSSVSSHDVFLQLSTKDLRDFRKSLKVQFVGEEAIDQGTNPIASLHCVQTARCRRRSEGVLPTDRETNLQSTVCLFFLCETSGVFDGSSLVRYGMFLRDASTQRYWFNQASFDLSEFKLIGYVCFPPPSRGSLVSDGASDSRPGDLQRCCA